VTVLHLDLYSIRAKPMKQPIVQVLKNVQILRLALYLLRYSYKIILSLDIAVIMIQSIKPEEFDKFNDLLADHLNELTTELKLCTDSKINKLLRAEVSNTTSMINGLSKHKLFASNYEELTKVDSSEDDEPAPPKRAPKQKKVAFEEKPKVVTNKERDIVAKPPRKRQQKSICEALLKVK
jgi:hypothetical protein